MEKNTLQQKFDMAIAEFSIGSKVCNYKIGTVGIVSGQPIVSFQNSKIFIPVSYDGKDFFEDAEQIFVVRSIPKGSRRNK